MKDLALGIKIKAAAITVETAQPGDIGVAHSKGIIGFLIRLFTRSTWNHVFVVVSAGSTPETVQVIQAEAHGVERVNLSDVAPGGSWSILACPSGVSRDLVVSEATALLRHKYGFVSIVSILFNLAMPFLRLEVHEGSTLICSAVGALALFNGGWEVQFPDLYSVTPATLAAALTA